MESKRCTIVPLFAIIPASFVFEKKKKIESLKPSDPNSTLNFLNILVLRIFVLKHFIINRRLIGVWGRGKGEEGEGGLTCPCAGVHALSLVGQVGDVGLGRLLKVVHSHLVIVDMCICPSFINTSSKEYLTSSSYSRVKTPR